MTKITIFRNHDGEYLGFDCLGHAGYADEGEDIVCAGISALVINTINSIGLQGIQNTYGNDYIILNFREV